MKHIGLFEGIGGFSLAARWMGWETVAWCEWNEFGQKILKHHFPEAEGHGDIKKTDFTKYANKIDILTGGFPCQPYSIAGKRKGTEDDRHLWPEMLRAIREIKPRYVVGENVIGIVNWDGGVVFEQVQLDLEAEGYEVQAVILPAVSVDAPHRRDRVWFVAYANNDGGQENTEWQRKRQAIKQQYECSHLCKIATNTHSDGFDRSDCEHEVNTSKRWFDALNDVKQVCDAADTRLFRQAEHEQQATGIEQQNKVITADSNLERLQRRHETDKRGKYNGKRAENGNIFRTTLQNNDRQPRSYFQNFPTQSPICGGDDGIPDRLDGITFPKWRNESIKAYGNAIVPQVALQIFKAIQQYDN